MLPSKRASLFLILFLTPCVFSFILPQPFRSLFESEAPQNTERQSDLSDQIIPVAIIAFTASLFNSFIAMLTTPQTAAVDCTYTGSNWHWGYEGVYGAACWGTHVPACNGLKQSPIDIPAKYGGLLPGTETTPLSMSGYAAVRFATFSNTGENYGKFHDDMERYGGYSDYDVAPVRSGYDGKREADGEDDNRVSNGIFKNNGHTAQLDAVSPLGASQGILRGGQLTGDYQILQLHFHWGANDNQGSEHTVDGKMYPLELHVVHVKVGEPDPLNTPKGLSVTGFFFEVDGDNTNTALAPLTNALAQIETADAQVDFSAVGFSLVDLLKPVAPIDGAARSSRYSTYEGSLTTPTCNEVVEWINFLTPLKISKAQLHAFRKIDDDYQKDILVNYRPPQPLNGRTVRFWA